MDAHLRLLREAVRESPERAGQVVRSTLEADPSPRSRDLLARAFAEGTPRRPMPTLAEVFGYSTGSR